MRLLQLAIAVCFGFLATISPANASGTQLSSAGTNLFSIISGLFGHHDSRDRRRTDNSSHQQDSPTTSDRGRADGAVNVAQNSSSPQLKLFEEDCMTVKNSRGEVYNVMVPTASKEEWDSIQKSPPPDVTISKCPTGPPPGSHCGHGLSFNDVSHFVAEASVAAGSTDPQGVATGQYPLPGYWPPYSSDAGTVDQICKTLGCGKGTLTSATSFNNPRDDAILRWNASTSKWEKIPARGSNSKLNHRTPTTISCAPAP